MDKRRNKNRVASYRSEPKKERRGPRSRRDLLIVLLLTITVTVVYAQVMGHEFLNYDDPEYVTANPHVRSGLTLDGVVWAFSMPHDANWIPLTWVSHMLDCQLFGIRSGPQHLMNVALHAANTILLFVLLTQLTSVPWPSAFVALTFALHPLHIESVAWIAERKDVLSGLFFLLTMFVYAHYVRRPTAWQYACVAALFCSALLSKPTAVTLPFILLLLDVWPLRRAAPASRLIAEKAPLLALSIAASVIAYMAQHEAGTVAALERVPAGLRFENALVSYTAYIGAFLWPSGLAVIYPYPGHIRAWQWMAAAGILGVATFFALRWRRERPYVAVGWFWFIGALLPVIGLVQAGVQSRADRYTYIPLIGIIIIAAWGAQELFEARGWNKTILASAAALLCLAYSVATSIELQNWHDSITLFRHAVEATRGNYVAYANLGVALNDARRMDDAIAAFESARRIRPDDEVTLDNLGETLNSAGRAREAIPILMEAVRLRPDYYKAHIDLGSALMQESRADDAAAQYRMALQIRPDGAEGHYGLGGALMARGNNEEALPHLRAALPMLKQQVQDAPEVPVLHYNLGRLYGILGRSDEAIEQFSQAIRLDPRDPQSHVNLGIALASRGRLAEAANQFQAAVDFNPEYLNARYNLARTLALMGRDDAAAREYEEILRANPDLAEARKGLEELRARPRSEKVKDDASR